MIRQSVFYPIIVGFIIGTLCGPVVVSWFFIGVVVAFSIGLIILTIATGNVREKLLPTYYSPIFILGVTLLWIAFGVGAFFWSASKTGDPILLSNVDTYVRLQGIVVDDPVQGDTATRVTVSVSRMESVTGERVVQPTNIILSVPPHTEVLYGDEVVIRGILEKPAAFETNNGGMFYYDKYLAARHIFYSLIHPALEVTASHKGNALKAFLFSVKRSYMRQLNSIIPFPESSLGAALTVAGKAVLPADILNDFIKAGVVPFVVLSGLHVTIVAEIIMWIFGRFSFFIFSPSRLSSDVFRVVTTHCAAIVGIIFFCLLAGAAAAVVRGGIMAVAVIVAKMFRRQYSAHRMFWMAAFLMVLVNPLLTVYDPSFQFSFVAVAGLLYGSPIFSRLLHFLPSRFGIRASVISTFSAQFFVLPLALYTMGQFSVVVPLTSLLLFFAIPPTMFACFISAILSFILPPIAVVAGWLTWLLLFYEISVIHFFAGMPMAFWEFPPFPLWALIFVYGISVIFLWRWYTRRVISLPQENFVQQPSN